jgi:hypothetical protein
MLSVLFLYRTVRAMDQCDMIDQLVQCFSDDATHATFAHQT